MTPALRRDVPGSGPLASPDGGSRAVVRLLWVSPDPASVHDVRARLTAPSDGVLVVEHCHGPADVRRRLAEDPDSIVMLDPRLGTRAREALEEVLPRKRDASTAPGPVLPVAAGDAATPGPPAPVLGAGAFEALANVVAEGVLVLDARNGVRLASVGAERLLAAPAGSLAGRRDLVEHLALTLPDGSPMRTSDDPFRLARWRGWRFVEGRVGFRRFDGRTGTMCLRVQRLAPPVGAEAHDLLVVLTEEARTPATAPAPRLEAAARVAGGIAHDFNNLLSVLQYHVEMLGEGAAPDDPGLEHVRAALDAIARSAGLTRQLLAFSRQQALQPAHFDLATFLGTMRPMLQHLVGERIALEIEVDPVLGRVRTDPTQLEQLVMNLVTNARDAMSGAGRLRLDAGTVELDEAFVATHPGARAGRHVRLSFADTGCGMDEATQQRVFEPFFTTKPRGRGSGLGLATAYGFVKQAGGYIGITSAPGAGTTVDVFLPHP